MLTRNISHAPYLSITASVLDPLLRIAKDDGTTIRRWSGLICSKHLAKMGKKPSSFHDAIFERTERHKQESINFGIYYGRRAASIGAMNRQATAVIQARAKSSCRAQTTRRGRVPPGIEASAG